MERSSTRLLQALAILVAIGIHPCLFAAGPIPSLLLSEQEQQLGPYSGIYLDASGTLDAAEVLSHSFSTAENDYVRFPNIQGSYWLRFRLENALQYPQRRILSLDYPHVEKITLYLVREGEPVKIRSLGVNISAEQRDISSRFPAVDFDVQPENSDEYLLNIVFFGKANHALEYELKLYPEQAFYGEQTGSFIIFAGYIGFMLSLLIYNMILYRSLGIRGYLYYSLYLLSQIVGVMSYEGFFYLLPGSFPTSLVTYLVTITPTLCGLFLINFGRDLLQLKDRMPRMNIFYIRVSLVLIALMAIAPLNLGWFNIGMEILGIAMIVCTAVISIHVYRMGSQAAKYFAISFGFLTIGYGVEMWLFSVENLDSSSAWIPVDIQYWMERYFYYSCSIFQMSFLSQALASFMLQIREEKDTAQQQALQNMEESNRLKEDYSSRLERDISERTAEITRQSDIMAEQTARLKQLDSLKSRFFANISHEFRTPLTLIRGPVQGLANGNYGTLNDKGQDALDICSRNVERLARLIDELLMLSELESGSLRLKVSYNDLSTFCKRTSGLFTHTALERDIDFQIKVPEQAIHMCFDPAKLETILCNLLSNAFKYTPRGGSVELSLEDTSEGEHSTGNFVEIIVQDDGPGIAAEEQANIFERFYRATSTEDYAVEGSGIGLALVKELVELHGGNVQLESEDTAGTGHGCRFVVSLPRGTDHLEQAEMQTFSAPAKGVATTRIVDETQRDYSQVTATAPNSARLLVVEDNEDMRAFIVSQFEGCYHVYQAKHGAQALEQLREQAVDLVISDVMMPEMDGISLLEHIRNDAELQDLPVILLTARASDEDRLLALRARADDFIAKPFNSEELVLKVENLLRRPTLPAYAESETQSGNEVETTSLDSADRAFLDKARQLTSDQLENADFDVETLASALFMSRSTLQRRMEQAAGTTPALFIRHLRLETAHRYISSKSHRTMAETAYAVGFKHPGYFSRLYKKYTNELPTT